MEEMASKIKAASEQNKCLAIPTQRFGVNLAILASGRKPLFSCIAVFLNTR